jgi:hypothetical protein
MNEEPTILIGIVPSDSNDEGELAHLSTHAFEPWKDLENRDTLLIKIDTDKQAQAAAYRDLEAAGADPIFIALSVPILKEYWKEEPS